ncbi:gluconokinase [Photobacterium profundum]|uniref:Gluconokinase n=1 Tax=Photobacterium profundum 3TCK TaxID=314280 RepID=Q1ZAC0_9GAMM|nr:gluconokinase [Photobacterium profundum]EAS45572.1 thermoresistant gluconokinase [Photobacterium profundum 3TCK]PSV63258.1 gluconokinase [Photobacterium profundum]
MAGKSIIVMGVSACGKSTVGQLLANRIGAKFIDGDDLHPKANILKMSRGEPLDDKDREPWLERIRDAAFSLESKNETGVLVCSALKKSYRDQIREGNSNVTFLFLDGDFELILERMRSRTGHFMKENMVRSQFDVLERPTNEHQVITVDINNSMDGVLNNAISALEALDISRKAIFDHSKEALV